MCPSKRQARPAPAARRAPLLLHAACAAAGRCWPTAAAARHAAAAGGWMLLLLLLLLGQPSAARPSRSPPRCGSPGTCTGPHSAHPAVMRREQAGEMQGDNRRHRDTHLVSNKPVSRSSVCAQVLGLCRCTTASGALLHAAALAATTAASCPTLQRQTTQQLGGATQNTTPTW